MNLAVSAQIVWGKIWTILLAIIFFGFIILIHELGHFLWAKKCGVKVNEFAIGMGPAILKKKRGETQYSLRLLPIGGYVSMEGENEESEDPRAFNNTNVWKRIIIIIAGAFHNIILGILILALLLGASKELIGTNTIKEFQGNASSHITGLEEGDKILKVNGRRIFSERDLSFLMGRSKDGVFEITVKRNRKKIVLPNVKFESEKQGKITVIHYDFIIVGEAPGFLNVLKNSFTQTASIVRMVWLSLFDMITGRYGLSELAGPVGTVQVISNVAQNAAKTGNMYDLLLIMAFITINIGVANLLPLPALDGGHLLFLLIEAVRKRPVSRKKEGIVHAVGFGLLMLLMLVVTFNDILRIIKG